MSPLFRRGGAPRDRDRTEHGAIVPAPLQAELRVGTRIAGYELQDVVGRGGMGVVYRARHVTLGRVAALKLLVPALAEDESFRERFLRESQIAAQLDHPNVVTIYDAGEADGVLYIAMRFVDGVDLAELLRRERALAPPRAIRLLGQVADALDAAHALGLVHRDVKPGNVLVDDERCYLTDFGLTRRAASRTALTARGQFVGTVDYMPPEQIEGRELDARADVYALGCVLYEALTGAVPYGRESEVATIYAHLRDTPPSVRGRGASLPAALDAVFARALAKRAGDRYATCRELVAAAGDALGLADTPAEGGEERRAGPAPRTVLIADRDPAVRAMIRLSLAGAERPLSTVEAGSIQDALALAQREPPDLVFLDWALAAAAETCAALRGNGERADTKIVAVTARQDAAEPGEALAAGADAVLPRPFSSLQDLHAVDDLLGAPER